MELHAEYRRAGSHDIQNHIAHGRRQERLQAIQQELAQLAELGRRVLSIEERIFHHFEEIRFGDRQLSRLVMLRAYRSNDSRG